MTGNAKLFADNTSLFSVVYEENTYAKELNNDLKKVNDWAFQWKMSKQAQEVIFSRKSKRSTHSPLVFNNVFQIFSQKHLGVILDFKLTFEEHLNNVLAKVNKAVDLLRKLCNILPRTTLITKLSFSYIWTRVMSCTIKPLINCLKKNWNLFSIMHV